MHQFIDGAQRAGSSGDTHDVIDPSNGQVIDTVDLASVDDCDAAVAAAKRAFPEWAGATPAERSGALAAAARVLEGMAEELASTESRQAGKPIRLARGFGQRRK